MEQFPTPSQIKFDHPGERPGGHVCTSIGDRSANRSRIRPKIALPLVLALSTVGCAGTGARHLGGGLPTGSDEHIVILVSATATEPRPTLPRQVVTLLRAAAENHSATDGWSGRGSSAQVVAAAGRYSSTFPLTPRRRDGSVEHGLNREHLIDENLTRVEAAVKSVHATEEGLDLVGAL